MKGGLDTKEGEEATATGETIMRDTSVRVSSAAQNGAARVVVAVTAFGLLTALWVVLWVPSAPIP
jgi:hypothetical protein